MYSTYPYLKYPLTVGADQRWLKNGFQNFAIGPGGKT